MQCNTAPYIIGHGKHPPCKNRAETVHPWLTKQKSHEIFRSTASTVDIPNHWDLQQRRLRPVADARRSCWGSGQQDASATQGTRRMLGAATRNSKQQPTGLIACGAVRRRLVRAPSIVQTKRKTSTQRVLVFLGAMEGTRTPGLLIRSQSLYPAELPTHTFRSEHDVFYHAESGLSTGFLNFFDSFLNRASFRTFSISYQRAHQPSCARRWAIFTPVGVAARPPWPVSRRSGESRLPTRPMASMTSSQGIA